MSKFFVCGFIGFLILVFVVGYFLFTYRSVERHEASHVSGFNQFNTSATARVSFTFFGVRGITIPDKNVPVEFDKENRLAQAIVESNYALEDSAVLTNTLLFLVVGLLIFLALEKKEAKA
jgi:hypothetical protein